MFIKLFDLAAVLERRHFLISTGNLRGGSLPDAATFNSLRLEHRCLFQYSLKTPILLPKSPLQCIAKSINEFLSKMQEIPM